MTCDICDKFWKKLKKLDVLEALKLGDKILKISEDYDKMFGRPVMYLRYSEKLFIQVQARKERYLHYRMEGMQ